MKRFVTVCLVLATLGVSAGHAQGVARIVGKSGLSPDDFAIMGENARGLYDVAAPKVGDSSEWSNPASKSYGTTTLTGLADGCANIQQVTHPKGQEQPLEILTRLCRNAEGVWVLQP